MVTLIRAYWPPISLTGILLIIALIVWATGDGILARTVTDALIRAVLVIGLYIFIGNSGVLAFGNVAFMLIGAYATAWLTMAPFKKSFALDLPEFLAAHQYPALPSAIVAGLLATLVAFIVGIPIMRLSGIAASIATLAVLGIFYTIYSNWDSWTLGASTLAGVPLYVNMWVALAWVVVALFAAYVYKLSRFGLALRATREDEVAARATGINIATQRLIAFVLGAFFMGIGGVLEAHFLGSLTVKTFWLAITFILLAMLIVGGQRSLTGAVIGVIAVSTIAELLRQLEVGFDVGATHVSVPQGAQELGLALLMLLILITRPSGIMKGREIPWPFGKAGAMRPVAVAEQPAPGSLAFSWAGSTHGGMRSNPTAASTAAESPANGEADTLQAHAVTVEFEGLVALEDVDITVGRDEIVGLIGPNGAGKTTLVNVLTGFQIPSRGKVTLGTEDVTGWSPERLGRAGLARSFQAGRLFRDLPVIENLEVAGVGTGLKRSDAERRAWDVLRWMNFEHRAVDLADTLPYGEERRVGIGRALTMAPRFALLDEPAAGLSDTECEELMKVISRIPQDFGCGVLLIEHNMRVIMGVCHRIHVIASGRTIAVGSPDETRNDPKVIQAYLGSNSKDRRG